MRTCGCDHGVMRVTGRFDHAFSNVRNRSSMVSRFVLAKMPPPPRLIGRPDESVSGQAYIDEIVSGTDGQPTPTVCQLSDCGVRADPVYGAGIHENGPARH